ncbi:MAG: STAS domain-containing protein [Thermoanaerobaculales bacterium]|nr:STAS domain-containing protein [Thermoanaerobaculales bacterium]
MALNIERKVSSDETVISVAGDVDLYTSPELRKAVLEAVPGAAGRVAVDLSGVNYIDSSGIATLVEGLRSAHKHDKAFVLVTPSPPVMQVLELSKLDNVFEVRTTS